MYRKPYIKGLLKNKFLHVDSLNTVQNRRIVRTTTTNWMCRSKSTYTYEYLFQLIIAQTHKVVGTQKKIIIHRVDSLNIKQFLCSAIS